MLIIITVHVTFAVHKTSTKHVFEIQSCSLFQLFDGGDPANGPYSTLLGEKNGFTLGEMVFQNDSIPLTVKGLLTDCGNDAPAWEALYISNFFDLDTVLDYGSVSLALNLAMFSRSGSLLMHIIS